MGDMERERPSLAARMRLARRVADALLPQDDDVLVEAVATADTLTGETVGSALRTDFLVTVLDLRVRVALLPGRGADTLLANETLDAAAKLLWDHPESLACLLVADDEPLSSRLVEFSELSAGSRDSAPVAAVGTVREVLADYLATLRPVWPPPPTISASSSVSFEGVLNDASAQGVAGRKALRSTIAERKDARTSLSKDDQRFISRLASLVLLGRENEYEEATRTLFRAAK